MLKLAAKRKIIWPVTVSIPQDGGGVRREKFEIEFELISADEVQKVISEGADLLDTQVVGWPKGPKGDDDQPVAFTPEAKKELIGTQYARQALFEALGEINTGRAARKN